MYRFLLKVAFAAGLGTSLAMPVAFAQQGGDGLGRNFSGLEIDGDQPVSIEANQLDVDDNQAVATFTGNVQVVQGETELRTGKLVVAYERNAEEEEEPGSRGGAMPGASSSIRSLEATNDVYVKSSDQVATADRASFDMASDVITMSGNVVLTQGDNVAEGCRLTIQASTGQARLESGGCGGSSQSNGRVRLMLSPESGDGASTN